MAEPLLARHEPRHRARRGERRTLLHLGDQLVPEPERVDEGTVRHGDPGRTEPAGRVVDVVDLPTEVGELVPLPRVDHDPMSRIVDTQPDGAVGAIRSQLGTEHLRAERPPLVGVRRPEPDVGEVLDHAGLVSVVAVQ